MYKTLGRYTLDLRLNQIGLKMKIFSTRVKLKLSQVSCITLDAHIIYKQRRKVSTDVHLIPRLCGITVEKYVLV